ncbi:Phospholipase D1 [Hypsibius exemplaris]|uniref:Phospholipase D1 n=1 Tax=Hypsibius exemplaris TaxID=2072580 RepID=A0A9X6NQE8_HYPEX|nr:Phospholipase D1 [Hypsibius exemplaris]
MVTLSPRLVVTLSPCLVVLDRAQTKRRIAFNVRISPELQLKRPVVGRHWRLDNLLARKASEGVRIFVLLYHENNLTDFLNSAHTKKALEDLYPGSIQVICHPNQASDEEKVLWCHNEKVVVVDQSIALFGGMDLCFGQWDNYQHRLFESASPKWIMRDSLEFDLSARNGGLNSTLRFGCPNNVSRCNTRLGALEPIGERRTSKKGRDQDNGKGVRLREKESANAVVGRSSNDARNIIGEYAARVWLGQDFMNRLVKNKANDGALTPSEGQAALEPPQHARLPWHDVGAMVAGSAATDLARHFIQRWNFAQRSSPSNSACRFLLPKVARQLPANDDILCAKAIHQCSVQVLRSLGSWSGSTSAKPEDSIQKAMVWLIENSEHYIYMETEVFISAGGNNSQVTNAINDALVRRILRAYTYVP